MKTRKVVLVLVLLVAPMFLTGCALKQVLQGLLQSFTGAGARTGTVPGASPSPGGTITPGPSTASAAPASAPTTGPSVPVPTGLPVTPPSP